MKTLRFSIAFICLLFCMQTSWCEDVYYNGHKYRTIIIPQDFTWHQSRDSAISLGGYLAVANSAEENNFLAQISYPYTTFLGGTDEEAEGNWHWINGDTWSFTAWRAGEPNNAWADEDYIGLSSLDSQWNDMRNWFIDQQVFIVEWDINCGDINNDCSIDILDIVYYINWKFKNGPPPYDMSIADLNSDGEYDILDIVYFVNYKFKNGPQPNCAASIGSVVDIDGNTYKTIKIGDQWWMAENLRVTHFGNGEAIPNITDNSTWIGLSTPAYCEFNNNIENLITYGCLYNWYAVNDIRGIAPSGWHVPTDEEWKQLEMYLGMSQADADLIGYRGNDEGGKLKESGTIHWFSPNTGATNESGFTALPGGSRSSDGTYSNLGSNAGFWSSTEYVSQDCWFRYLYFHLSGINHSYDNKRSGFSVRCVKD